MALGEETWRRESSWAETFKELKTYHDNAYRKIEEALRFDEEGQKTKALSCYEEGLVLIDRALSVNIECPSNPDFTWEKACSMIDKLRKTRKETLIRIADTQVQRPEVQQFSLPRPEDPLLEPPPSYEEAMATSLTSLTPSNMPSLPPSSSRVASTSSAAASSSGIASSSSSSSSLRYSRPPQTYSELGEALQNLKIETKMQSAQIIFNVENVRIYFITPDGRVSAPSLPNLLRVLELEDGQDIELPKYFLQVGDWFYPLVPEVSPCFRAEFGAFILPDVNSDIEGAAVGLVLPPGADTSLQALLEDILQPVAAEPPEAVPLTRALRDTFSTTISKGIISGAQYLSTGLVKGAERASQYMNSTTPKIISHLQPEEVPRPVPDSVRKGTKVARSVTHTAANVSSYVAGKVGSATMAFGRYLAPHVHRGGTALLTKAGVREQAAEEGMGGVLTVAAGAVQGFGTIYTGLEQASGILGNSLANNTVQIVHHKYGEPMASVTGDTLYTVGNVINTTNNIHNLTPKGLAKKTARDTGKALVEPHFNQPSTSKKK